MTATDNSTNQCQVMSVDGNAQHSARKDKEKNAESEDWGDDTSIILRNDKTSVGTVILKIFFALIFIGLATGALIYAVNNSEEQQKGPSDKTQTLYFPYDITQQCTNGTLGLVHRRNSSGEVQKYTVRKFLNDDHKEIS
uniref:Integral membrane protein 2 n=1 Tax=Angiostrongylus cantonensis TaxID=6313 RepID=A0A0K0D077_ANGCA